MLWVSDARVERTTPCKRREPMDRPRISTEATPAAWCEDCEKWIHGGPAAVVDHHSRFHCAPNERMRRYRLRQKGLA